MELKYILIPISMLGILCLYGLTLLSQPSVIALSELEHHEGNNVIVEGIVLTYRSTSYGGQIIEIRDTNATTSGFKAIVFSEQQTAVEYGDTIQASGKVQKYQNEWEVVVDNEKSIHIIKKWQNTSFPLWQLAEYPERYIGIKVNVTGVAERMYDTYFYLADDEGRYSVLITFNSTLDKNISTGDYLSIHATFTYDDNNLRYLLQLLDEPYLIIPQKE